MSDLQFIKGIYEILQIHCKNQWILLVHIIILYVIVFLLLHLVLSGGDAHSVKPSTEERKESEEWKAIQTETTIVSNASHNGGLKISPALFFRLQSIHAYS